MSQDNSAKIDMDRSGIKPGDRLGPYRVLRPIGSGGMGSVFEAIHDDLEKRCAIKVLNDEYSSNQKVVRRFLNEARAVARIRHENIIDVYDFGRSPDKRYYFVMELLEGSSLADELKQVGALPVPRACLIAGQVARALAASHAAGIVHRDLKPQNLMLIRRAQTEDFVKVLDFGVAKVLTKGELDQTESGLVIGTTRYMAPEQCRGGKEVDHRCDVYALGLIFYNMLAGKLPFDADNPGDLMVQHLTKAPPPLKDQVKDLPEALEKLVMKALEKNPADRFQDMDELGDVLVAFGGPPRGAAPVVREPLPALEFDFDADDTPAIPSPASSGRFPAPITQGTALERPSPPRRSKSSAPIWIGLGVVAVLGVAGALALNVRGDKQANVVQPVVAPVTPAPEVKPPSLQVVLSISSEPNGAQVFLADEPKGVTPLDLKVKRGEQRMPLRLTKDGFEPYTQMVVPDTDQMLSWALRPSAKNERPTAEAKKRARPTPAKKQEKTRVDGILEPSY
jgi:serine/threonine-protein kinase